MIRVTKWRASLCVSLVAAGLAACFTSSDALDPPTDRIYFPTGVAISPGRSTLYVASSDFDLRYNGGTVAAIELGGDNGIRAQARSLVKAFGEFQPQRETCLAHDMLPNANPTLYPGPCDPKGLAPFIRAFATIGAFTSGAALVTSTTGDGARLFLTVRGDPSVTYFDVPDDRGTAVTPCGEAFCLSCDEEGPERRCGGSHRIGTNPYTSLRRVVLPTEPVGIDATAAPGGDAIVVAHQTEGAASLVVNSWERGTLPTLEFSIRDLPDGPTNVAAIPVPKLARVSSSVAYRPGFIVSHRGAPELSVLRYEDDAESKPSRPFLIKTSSVPITLSSDGADNRGVAIDIEERAACEKAAGDNVPLLTRCLDLPARIYVANRAPNALLIGTIETETIVEEGVVVGISERISFDRTVTLDIGASSVSLGKIIGPDGEFATRVFVVSFDARFVVGYDPVLDRIDMKIRTGRGPFGLAFDVGVDDQGEAESFLYIGHFTDSYIGVVDLDARNAQTFGSMLLSIGPPATPREEL